MYNKTITKKLNPKEYLVNIKSQLYVNIVVHARIFIIAYIFQPDQLVGFENTTRCRTDLNKDNLNPWQTYYKSKDQLVCIFKR